MTTETIRYVPLERCHLSGVIGLCEAENWPSYTKDPETTWRILTAPGVTTVVAVESGQVIGFVQMQSDGVIQAHLSLILVAKDRRKQRIGRRLVLETFARTGAQRVDLITEDAPGFYRSFAHKEWFGFRLHPGCDPKTPNDTERSTP